MNSEQSTTVAIIGTGRLGQALGVLLLRSGVPIITVEGRSSTSVLKLAPGASHILIAVRDGAIPQVASDLAAAGLRDATVLHTSAAAGPEALAILRSAGNSIGVLHPLQTVPSAERGIETLPGATWAYAGDERATAWSQSLVARLQGKTLAVDPAHWPLYHAAAVMACNYQVTLVDAALELMEIAGIERADGLDALSAMLRATTENILTLGPEAALTGPVKRGDFQTIRAHLDSLSAARPETKRLYVAAGLRTVAFAGLSLASASKVTASLEGTA